MTQRQKALAGAVTPGMETVARSEGVPVQTVLEGVAAGWICIPANRLRLAKGGAVCGIGKGLRTKVSASVGYTRESADHAREMEKVSTALGAGADLIMEMSTGGDTDTLRHAVLERASVPLGTIPIYQAAAISMEQHGADVYMSAEELLGVFERHAAAGADLMVVHAAATLETLQRARQRHRVMDMVSYGGALILGWMLHHQRENPLYESFDRILEIARRHDVTLALADSWRPGCIADSLDLAQVQEVVIMGELVDRALHAGVQVLVKGPGQVPLGQIKTTTALNKKLCHGVPFFVFGPMVTGLAPGHDHIAGAIGAAAAAAAGADFICPVTPGEQLGRSPDPADVRTAVVASRIAAHAGDLAKGLQRAHDRDRAMSQARKALDWRKQFRLALDPEGARNGWRDRNARPKGYAASRESGSPVACSMCGQYCAMALVSGYLGDASKGVETK